MLKACVLFYCSAVDDHDSKADRNMDMTRGRISFTFDPRDMTRGCISFTFDPRDMLSLHVGFSFVKDAVAYAIHGEPPVLSFI